MIEKEWYHPNRIKFTRQQVKWLIYHLPTLRNGNYPRNPKETGYSDSGIRQKQVRSQAKFEVPAGIAAELDLRIQRAGVDGLMLEFLYSLDPDDELFVIEHMAQCLNLDRKDVSQRVRNALYFVSGSGRKTDSYSRYVSKSRSYLKITPRPFDIRKLP